MIGLTSRMSIAKGWGLGLALLLTAVWTWGDVINIASVSFQDSLGNLLSGLSNPVRITVPATLPAPLPVPDLGQLDGHTFTTTDSLQFVYPQPALFEWTLTSLPNSATLNQGLAANIAGSGIAVQSSAPQLKLGDYALSPGVYSLTVQVRALDGSAGPSAHATFTLLSADLSAIKVFPNPWRRDRGAGQGISFENLPPDSKVMIFTVSGHIVRQFDSSGGRQLWDLTNDAGSSVASGVYLFVITDAKGQRIRGKLAIVR